ncbi:hypothetical protein VPH35_026625 [Triticum aestivum]
MASSDAPDAAIAIAAPIPVGRVALLRPLLSHNEQSGAKEAGSGGKQSHSHQTAVHKPDRTDRTPAWESEKLYGHCYRWIQINLTGMFSRFPTDAFRSYGTGAYH